jgi:hypothetical protein
MVSLHDKFWAEVQLELAGLPKADNVLPKLREIDPKLHHRLRKAERWLARPNRTLLELRQGWGWWIKSYRHGIRLVEQRLGGRYFY